MVHCSTAKCPMLASSRKASRRYLEAKCLASMPAIVPTRMFGVDLLLCLIPGIGLSGDYNARTTQDPPQSSADSVAA
jgi:hypothetical protein